MTITAFILNILVATLLGVAIGLERQFRQHPAGLRTNALVCLERLHSRRCLFHAVRLP